MRTLFRDVRLAIRSLGRTRGFAAVAVVTLALGIGANAAMFSVVNGVLLRPLPFGDVDRIVRVTSATPTLSTDNHSAGEFLDIVRLNHSLSSVAGYRPTLVDVSAGGAAPIQLGAAYVTPPFFDVLGTPAELGRVFTAGSAAPGSRLAVFSHDGWHQAFGDDPSVVGRAVRVSGQSFTVAGVMPPGFAWPEHTDVWLLSDKDVPPSPIDNGEDPANRQVGYIEAIARLRPGLTMMQAQADLTAVGATIARDHPDTESHREIRLSPLRDAIVGDIRPALLVLQGAVGFVLLIACANISSLLIARTASRRRELAIRAALGAGRRDLVRQLLTESLVLGAAGGLAGLLVGSWLMSLLLRIVPGGMPRLDAIHLDRTVTAVTMVVALATGVLFGILPALQASRVDATGVIKDAGERGSAGRTRGRSVLVVGEVALTLVLLVSAGLFVNSFVHLTRVDSGFAPDRVVIGELLVPQARYATGAQQTALYSRLLERLSAHGQLQAVGLGFPGPLHGSDASGSFSIEGRSFDGGTKPRANLATVSSGYFPAMGLRLIAGRTFSDRETAGGPGVVVVSESLVRRYFAGRDALGAHISFDDDPKAPWATIVGVVSDARQLGLQADPPPLAYIPFAQFPLPFTTVAVRSPLPESQVAALLRADLASVDRDLPWADILTLPSILDRSMAQPRFRTTLVGVFAALALVLAAVGLYGLVSYSVTQRTREFGIRVALGARPGQILLPVLREGVGLAAAGVLIGLAGALALTRVLARFLFGIGATDPVTFAVVAVVLLAVTALASYLPSRRAARVDPVIALRD
jgi:putative ABC transport system permease protein